MTSCVEVIVNGRLLMYDIGCRTASDWYVRLIGTGMVADHLPSYAAAISYLKGIRQ